MHFLCALLVINISLKLWKKFNRAILNYSPWRFFVLFDFFNFSEIIRNCSNRWKTGQLIRKQFFNIAWQGIQKKIGNCQVPNIPFFIFASFCLIFLKFCFKMHVPSISHEILSVLIWHSRSNIRSNQIGQNLLTPNKLLNFGSVCDIFPKQLIFLGFLYQVHARRCCFAHQKIITIYWIFNKGGLNFNPMFLGMSTISFPRKWCKKQVLVFDLHILTEQSNALCLALKWIIPNAKNSGVFLNLMNFIEFRL